MNYGAMVYSFEYNDSGIRTSKTVNGIEHVYALNGSQIVTESWVQSGVEYVLVYLYDESGAPMGMQYRNSTMAEGVFVNFYFEKNLFGDIVAVYNESGVKVLSYYYDAWGNHTTTWHNSTGNNTYAQYNPFRYRGYYYDTETQIYYLQSRYYDPVTGRFINLDSYLSTGTGLLGYNMYIYCNNNPVMLVDPTGDLPFLVVTAAIGAITGAIAGAVIALNNGGDVWAGAAIGAAAGALIGTGAGAAAGAALAGSIVASTTAVAVGGNTLLAVAGSGGLAAGATYIANNLSQATSNFAPTAQTAAVKMQDVVTKGKAGETLSGLTKNTTHIPSLTGTASYRIPDGLDVGMKILSEVKNYSGTLSYTNQLKDFVMWSQANGYQMHLYTNAKLSGPLQQLVDSGIIQLFPLG